MDSNNATLVEAKKAYTNQLISLLTPQIYEGMKHIYETGRQNMKGKNVRHSFQLELQDVSLWNQIVIDKETERIVENTQCKYLDKLVTVIFINSTKILASAYIGNHATNTLEISVPKLAHFVHFVYIETAKEFYKNPYLFDENIPSREKQDNLRNSIECIKTGIEQAILKLLPIEDILNRDISNDLPQVAGGEELKQLEGDVLDPLDSVEDHPESDHVVEDESESVVEDESEPVVEDESDHVVEDESEPVAEDEFEPVEQVDDAESTHVLGRESPLNVEDISDEEEVQVEEQNFVKRTLSSDGTGIDVEKVNEDNKEFIEENKDSSDLVDNLVDTINLKSIDLSPDDSGKPKNNGEVTVSKLETEHEELPKNEDTSDEEQLVVGGDSEVALEAGEDTTTELEGDLEAGEDFVQESLEVGEVNDDNSPPVVGSEDNVVAGADVVADVDKVDGVDTNEVEGFEVVENVDESVREEAENMLSSLKQDLETSLGQQAQPAQPVQQEEQSPKEEESSDEESSDNEQTGTRYVNPYRMRRKANERRMQRLKNVKIKKKYLVNY